MKKIVITGAGGHCKVVLDLLRGSGEYEPIGLLGECEDKEVMGVPVLGTDHQMGELYRSGIRFGFVAIGSNAVRESVTKRMKEVGFQMITVVSRQAIISPYAEIGEGSVIMPGAVVNSCAKIGPGCILNTNCSVDHDCKLGPFVHIAPGCAVSGKTEIGRGCFLGTGARVIDGIQIGENSVIGAGAAVVRDIPGNCMAVGVPAKIIKETGGQ